MRATILTLLFFHLIGVVASCGQIGYGPIGEVRDSKYHDEGIYVDLTASTNCIEIGEQLTFQVDIRNPQTASVRIAELPTLNLRILMVYWEDGYTLEKELQRLEFPYPADFQLTFQPGETRTYLWNWNVEIPPPNAPGEYTIKIMTQTSMSYLKYGVEEFLLQPLVTTGVGQIGLRGGTNGSITCADMLKTATPSS